MFRVNRSENRLVRLDKRRFADVDVREREHLQEWLVRMPDALGEELLILQKEFDGFAETRERLDLLALDKDGRLVVIENKLDDSGRDVVWQALKYVAYCSSLKKAEIVDIYQSYLDRWSEGDDAEKNLCEFLGEEEFDDLVLNPGNGQRLVLIAANFRKEVTATVLWLLGKGVQAKCFRVVPYSSGEELFVDLRQIIPTAEAADYMIRAAAKESEAHSVEGARKRGDELRRAFWTRALEELRARGASRFENISPWERNYLSCRTGVASCDYTLLKKKKEARVQLYLGRSAKENNWLFERLDEEKQEIEEQFGAELDWNPMDGNKASKICYSHTFDSFDDEQMIDWLCRHFIKLEEAFSKPLERLDQELKSQGGDGASETDAAGSDASA